MHEFSPIPSTANYGPVLAQVAPRKFGFVLTIIASARTMRTVLGRVTVTVFRLSGSNCSWVVQRPVLRKITAFGGDHGVVV